MAFGGQGGIDSVHDMILRMRSDLVTFGFFTRPTLSELESMTSFDDAVIYAVLHESIYCEGDASNWAADQVGKSLPEFKWIKDPSASSRTKGEPLFFSGEMIFPFMFEIYPELKRLREVAEILAQYKDWPKLYDEEVLAKNEVPVYAASYVDDM
jgi:hypothetical protein